MIISLLPALNGDCILVEYIPSRFILIDGGYADTYRDYLLPRMRIIVSEGGIIDLVVVTHIDGDHISGIIKMLEEEEMPITIGEIWYNGYRHVQSVAIVSDKQESFVHRNICNETPNTDAMPISAKQGCSLSTLIARKNIPWNIPAGGNAMAAPMSIQLGEATLHILSPNDSDLRRLSDFWKKRLIKDGLLAKAHSYEYWDDAFEFSLSKEKPGFHFHTKKVSKTYDWSMIKGEPYIPDNSATNGSSISFVLETAGKRVLFLGDSHAETVIGSLNLLYGEANKPYKFNAVKLSHHGSYNNNSPELLNVISSDKWLISTNGDKYNHPDKPTLAHIITKEPEKYNQLFFNYNLPLCDELMKDEYHDGFEFEIIAPRGDDGLEISI